MALAYSLELHVATIMHPVDIDVYEWILRWIAPYYFLVFLLLLLVYFECYYGMY